MKKKVTIKDVALQSGVSIATVSQILNGNAEKFSQKTVQKVLQVSDDLGYYPDYFAQRMVMKKSQVIGILIPDISNPFFASLVKGIENVLYRQQYMVMLCEADFSGDKENHYLEELVHRGIDGFIIASSTISSQLLQEQLVQNQIPFVVLDQTENANISDWIGTADYLGGCLVANHLKDLGHHKLAVLGPQKASHNIQERLAGIRTLYPHFTLIDSPLTREGGIQAAYQVLNQDITAIVALNDELAAGVMYQLQVLGKSIPADYSVIGYDNSPICRYMVPSLTTIAQPVYELGEEAARLLLSRLKHPDKPWVHKRLPVQLITRDSTAHLK